MHSETPSEPPDEPHLKSEPHLLSPASPKPIHFPAPAAIPVLENMMDIGFNQTEAHMADPAVRNAEARANIWRDPHEVSQDHASPFSTGGEVAGDAAAANSAAAAQNEHSPSAGGNAQTHADAQPHETPFPPSDPNADSAAPSDPNTAQTRVSAVNPEQAPLSAFNTNVDMRALLDGLQSTPSAATANGALAGEGFTVAIAESHNLPAHLPVIGGGSSPDSASALGAPPSGLPPRPPPQEQPIINRNYVHSQHIRDYHPHAAHSAYSPSASNASGNVADLSSRNYVPPVPGPNMLATTPQDHSKFEYQQSSLSVPPHQSPMGNRQYASLTSPMDARRDTKTAPLHQGGTETPNDHRPWNADVQRKYDRFLEEERDYVSEGKWEQFPGGSRLFVGNLSSEKVTKRDVFHVFHYYGEIAQVSIKQAYGFVQFLSPDSAQKAIIAEEGRLIKDKKIHLEVSKPQKNRPNRRSRSPEYHRGGRQSSHDNFRGGNRGGQHRDDDRRYSDHRRGYRSPSPRSPRGMPPRDRHGAGYRSRSPGGYRRGSGARHRSPSPSRRSEEDDLPLPRRQAHEVPELQIIVLDSLERDFIAWIEKAFASRGVRIDVLILSPRLSEQAVVRRQIVEGVLAVSKLTRVNRDSGKISMQIFDRSGGAGNVKFEEYDHLDPQIAVELLLRAKAAQQQRAGGAGAVGVYGAQQSGGSQQLQYGSAGGYAAPATPYQQQHQYPTPGAFPPGPYSQPQHPPPQQPQQYQSTPIPAAAPPHLQNLITSLDPNGLQSLLSALNTPQTAGTAYSTPSQPPSASYPPPPAQQQDFGQQQAAAMAAAQSNPQAFAGFFRGQQQQQPTPGGYQSQPPPSQPQYGQQPLQQVPSQFASPPQHQQGGQQVNMADILARLGTYGQQRGSGGGVSG